MTNDIKETGCSHEAPARLPEPRRKIVNKIVKYLRTRLSDFDGIAISGYSMAMIGSIVAYRLNVPLCVIAKQTDNRNTCLKVEGIHSQRWLMIDDLVASGATLERVYKGVQKIDGSLVGVVLWKSHGEGNTVKFYSDKKYDEPPTRVPLWLSFPTDL